MAALSAGAVDQTPCCIPLQGIKREEPIDIIDEDATEDEDTHVEQQRRNRREAGKARADENEDEDDDTTLGFGARSADCPHIARGNQYGLMRIWGR